MTLVVTSFSILHPVVKLPRQQQQQQQRLVWTTTPVFLSNRPTPPKQQQQQQQRSLCVYFATKRDDDNINNNNNRGESVPAAATNDNDVITQYRHINAAVIVPGFLTSSDAFESMAAALTARGIPSIPVHLPAWHWIPCLGGRSVRPLLERMDYTVQHVVAKLNQKLVNSADTDSDINISPALIQEALNEIPPYQYNLCDLWYDFQHNPGGIFKVGGSDKVDDYPVVEPRGTFHLPSLPSQLLHNDDDDNNKKKQVQSSCKIILIGHSAGGWISRVYLSNRNYGGRAYRGNRFVHSLVTLGTPHATAPGPAFQGIAWCQREPENTATTTTTNATTTVQGFQTTVRQLAVGGIGFVGKDWPGLTQGAYQFCCPQGSSGLDYDGDGVTPIQFALANPGADTMMVPNVTHFCWSDVFGSNLVAPLLTEDHRQGRPWYGSDSVMDQWISWITTTTNTNTTTSTGNNETKLKN